MSYFLFFQVMSVGLAIFVLKALLALYHVPQEHTWTTPKLLCAIPVHLDTTALIKFLQNPVQLVRLIAILTKYPSSSKLLVNSLFRLNTSFHFLSSGWYCPLGTGHDWQPCPRGTYSPVEFLSREEQCKPCEPGQFCAFLNSTSTTGECDAGFFCLNGSDQQQPSGGNRGDAGICPSGRYCPKGDPLAPILCPAGHYNNRTHATSFADCKKCPGGQYCEESGLSWPSGPCDAGYY